MKNRPSILLALPASNEENILEGTISTIMKFFNSTRREFRWHLVISVNGSTDATLEIAKRASKRFPSVSVIHTPQPGKGLAIRRAWESGEADVYAFTDADLAADLNVLPILVRGVLDGCDIYSASRRLPGASVDRPRSDRLVSKGLNLVVRAVFGTKLTDTACGLKAVSPRVVKDLVPLVRNTSWAFDTELVLLAESHAFRITEVPAGWREKRTGGILRHVRTALIVEDYLAAMFQLRMPPAARAPRLPRGKETSRCRNGVSPVNPPIS